MEDMNRELEDLLLTRSLSDSEHDTIEHALDDGYDALSDKEKSMIRRLLNRKAAGRVTSPLARYRAHRSEIAAATMHHVRSHSKANVQPRTRAAH